MRPETARELGHGPATDHDKIGVMAQSFFTYGVGDISCFDAEIEVGACLLLHAADRFPRLILQKSRKLEVEIAFRARFGDRYGVHQSDFRRRISLPVPLRNESA